MLANTKETAEDNKGRQESKPAKNKGLTTTKQQAKSPSNRLAKVPADDCTNTANVHNSNKLNNKPDNKPGGVDAELAEIAQAWPSLPLPHPVGYIDANQDYVWVWGHVKSPM